MASVMVVDDSGYARRTHRAILEGGGYTVTEASTGMSAIEGYFLHRPDVVLLDLSMEDLGGLDVLRKLREIDPAVRVVVVSADVQRTTEKMVSEAGALAFLGKPASREQLLDTVQSVVGAPEDVR